MDPSQPTMFGINQKPSSSDGKTMDPIKAHNIQIMSIGFLVDQETPYGLERANGYINT
jgi:ATP-binding protein involved in chromosome partitioning